MALHIRKIVLLLFTASTFQSFAGAQENQKILKQLCVVQSPKINENSGIGFSNVYEDAIWTHNDSGAQPVVYLVSSRTGQTLASFRLSGAINRDWEDIDTFQIGNKNYLAIADVGDNGKARNEYQLCIFPEPELNIGDHQDPEAVEQEIENWKDLRFTYEDGSHNCEAIAFHAQTSQVILLEKVYTNDVSVPGVYSIELPKEKTDEPLTARRIGDLPIKNITAMDLSRDGLRMVIRTYVDGYLWEKTEEQTWAEAIRDNKPKRLALPMQRQGEGICFNEDESGVVCSSEFSKAPLWEVLLKGKSSKESEK